MARVPGSGAAKKTRIVGLNAENLPYLVADILYFQLNHRNVRVTDGPGDGKRDIHSVTPSRAPHVTQCKFHDDLETATSSAEIAELVTALHKFGSTKGIFATNGRISPQAKREFLNDYPAFELIFMDGTDLVDEILSSPILSTVWTRDAQITGPRSTYAVPFVLRNHHNDTPIEIESLAGSLTLNDSTVLSRAKISRAELELYRPPTLSDNELSRNWISGYVLHLHEIRGIHEIPLRVLDCAERVKSLVPPSITPYAVRFGKPAVVGVPEAWDDRVVLERVPPFTAIIQEHAKPLPEPEWFSLTGNPDWIFPTNLSTLQAPWAGWYSKSHDTLLQISLEWPSFGQELLFREVESAFRREWIADSLFAASTSRNAGRLLRLLGPEQQPELKTVYGPGGLLWGWLHPAITAQDAGDISFGMGKEGRFFKCRYDLDLQGHEQRIKTLRDRFEFLAISEVSAEKAILITQVADTSLLYTEPPRDVVGSAEIALAFEDAVPSPAYAGGRVLHFVQMWEIPAKLTSLSRHLSRAPKQFDGAAVSYHAAMGFTTQRVFVRVEISFTCPATISTDAYFELILHDAYTCIAEVSRWIKQKYSKARLATGHFLREEVGFRLDDSEFAGTPWIRLDSNEGSTVILHKDDPTRPEYFH